MSAIKRLVEVVNNTDNSLGSPTLSDLNVTITQIEKCLMKRHSITLEEMEMLIATGGWELFEELCHIFLIKLKLPEEFLTKHFDYFKENGYLNTIIHHQKNLSEGFLLQHSNYLSVINIIFKQNITDKLIDKYIENHVNGTYQYEMNCDECGEFCTTTFCKRTVANNKICIINTIIISLLASGKLTIETVTRYRKWIDFDSFIKYAYEKKKEFLTNRHLNKILEFSGKLKQESIAIIISVDDSLIDHDKVYPHINSVVSFTNKYPYSTKILHMFKGVIDWEDIMIYNLSINESNIDEFITYINWSWFSFSGKYSEESMMQLTKHGYVQEGVQINSWFGIYAMDSTVYKDLLGIKERLTLSNKFILWLAETYDIFLWDAITIIDDDICDLITRIAPLQLYQKISACRCIIEHLICDLNIPVDDNTLIKQQHLNHPLFTDKCFYVLSMYHKFTEDSLEYGDSLYWPSIIQRQKELRISNSFIIKNMVYNDKDWIEAFGKFEDFDFQKYKEHTSLKDILFDPVTKYNDL